MILKHDDYSQYLSDYKGGKIKMGLGIGIPEFDNHFRYKQGQFNMVNGLENTGKTAFMLWYFLCLSVKHNLKWTIWSGENKPQQLLRMLIEFYEGCKLKDLGYDNMFSTQAKLLEWFSFVDHKGFYNSDELFKIFEKEKPDGALIDPFTGMDRNFSHADNYKFLNEARNFTNESNITLYVNTHPNTEAARTIYKKDDDSFGGDVAGYTMPPRQSQSEGGQPFANRVDDFLTIHRFVGHPLYHFNTMVFVRKVKDIETGGIPTSIKDPIIFDYNKGLGFTCNGVNALGGGLYNDYEFEKMKVNDDFEDESAPDKDDGISDLPF